MSQTPDIRYVIVHRPGPSWKAGVDFREQPGVMQHVEYYMGVKERGKLALGGPFLDNTGGMMISTPGLSADEAFQIAAADPTVKSGLVTFEVWPWYVAVRG